MGTNYIDPEEPYNGEHGSGALTMFENPHVKVDRCTFTGNWNGADDKETGNACTDSIFWMNTNNVTFRSTHLASINPLHLFRLNSGDSPAPDAVRQKHTH